MESVPVLHDASATSDPTRRNATRLGALAFLLASAWIGVAQAQAPPLPPPGAATEEIVITAQRIGAVSTVKSDVGAASYSLGSEAIEALPGGADATAPGEQAPAFRRPDRNQDGAPGRNRPFPAGCGGEASQVASTREEGAGVLPTTAPEGR